MRSVTNIYSTYCSHASQFSSESFIKVLSLLLAYLSASMPLSISCLILIWLQTIDFVFCIMVVYVHLGLKVCLLQTVFYSFLFFNSFFPLNLLQCLSWKYYIYILYIFFKPRCFACSSMLQKTGQGAMLCLKMKDLVNIRMRLLQHQFKTFWFFSLK